MPTLQGSGSQLTVLGTEHTLLDIAIAGVFTFHIDPNVMVTGDLCELRIYTIMLTGGTRRGTYFTQLIDAQVADGMNQISVPVPNDLTDAGSLRYTLKQIVGTVHTYDWKVLKL